MKKLILKILNHASQNYFLYPICALTLTILISGCNFETATTSIFRPNVQSVAVQLNWQGSTGVVQGYSIEASTDNKTFTEVLKSPGTATSAKIPSISTGEIYYFRVRAYNQSGYSNYSATVSLTIPAIK